VTRTDSTAAGRILVAGLLAIAAAGCEPGAPPADLPRADVDSRLIANVLIVDGSGAPAVAGAGRHR
jgi:hypothetical protein